MKLITRHTAYAVGAILFAAKSKEDIISVEKFFKGTNIPRAFLRKILQILSKKKIFKSFKGKEGGFCLEVDPKKILLIDIANIFQGRLKISECFFRKKLCSNQSTCALKMKIDHIEKIVIRELETVTIGSFLKDKKKGRKK
ncbi:MAG: Rrf2 family transcriptional regulator [Candidatus Gygaella obscura]|nr:Rrf2 family transcriptional regulator [Candidatus Gygaella obscura]